MLETYIGTVTLKPKYYDAIWTLILHVGFILISVTK